MNRIDKPINSEIRRDRIIYRVGGDNTQLRNILKSEQKQVCAYTQVRFDAATADDIEHFNPSLKNTENDNYNNWFAVSHKWNITKGSIPKWELFQPILHPTANDLEQRIWYENGRYVVNDEDIEAKHLKDYLNLNQENLVSDRISHINGLKFILEHLDNDINQLRDYLNDVDPNQKQYLRAIETEFAGIRF